MSEQVRAGMTAPDFTYQTPDEQGLAFHGSIEGATTVLFFLRYVGCPLCQVKFAELRHDAAKFKEKGAAVFVVLQSDPAIVRQAREDAAMPFTVICDPDQEIFKLYDVTPGNLFHYIAPSVIAKSFRASRSGVVKGAKEGNELQRPAVFIIDRHKTVAWVHRGKNIGDVPDNAVILARLKGVRRAGR